MKDVVRAIAFLGLALGLADTACTSACLRNTDCGSGESCVSGTCMVIAVHDGSTVDGMTAKASSTPTPTASPTGSSPAPAGSADAALPSFPDAAGTFTPEAGYSLDGF